jgi:hypothetical protein
MSLPRFAAACLAFALMGATAAYAQAPPEAEAVMAACKGDIAKLCPNVPPGGGQIAAYLKAQKAQVSFHCKRALFQAKQAKDAAAQQSAPPH